MGKHIVITGTTKGLGRALVQPLVNRGHTISGCGRSASPIADLQASCPSPHRFDTVDVADWSQVQSWAKAVLEQNGPPDLVINNAGVINLNAPLWEISDDEFMSVMRVNLGGTASVIRAFVPAMIDAGCGVIVNLSSTWGHSTAPEVAPYCASKWGIEGLTQSMSQELPSGLAVVAVNPGIINTDMLQSCFGTGASSFPGPDDWAKTAVDFLLAIDAQDNGKSLAVM